MVSVADAEEACAPDALVFSASDNPYQVVVTLRTGGDIARSLTCVTGGDGPMFAAEVTCLSAMGDGCSFYSVTNQAPTAASFTCTGRLQPLGGGIPCLVPPTPLNLPRNPNPTAPPDPVAYNDEPPPDLLAFPPYFGLDIPVCYDGYCGGTSISIEDRNGPPRVVVAYDPYGGYDPLMNPWSGFDLGDDFCS
jgi:hypothetical protein